MDDKYRFYDEADNYTQSPDDMLEGTRSNALNAWIGNNPLSEDNDRSAAPAERNAAATDAEVNKPASDASMEESDQYERGQPGYIYQGNRSRRPVHDDWVMINRWEDI